jgi:Ser/Thr protein kinase RdoA (MazF antagonist)
MPSVTEVSEQMRALAGVALAQWSLDVVGLDLIKMRENAVFRVNLADGTKVALRIHRLGYHTDAELASEFVWMKALKIAGIDVPTPIPSRWGRAFESIDLGDPPGARQVSLFEWLDGHQLGSMEGGVGDDLAGVARCYQTVGRLAARMHDATHSWTPPAGFVRHAWDVDGLVGDSPLWGRFWALPLLSDAERTLLERVRTAIAVDLSGVSQSPDQYGLIHADLSPENIMVNGPAIRVIDFDDAGYGWHLFDLATSLYFLVGSTTFTVALEALIAGYRSERPLPDSTLQHLPLFFAARGTTYLGWILTRPQTDTAQHHGRDLIDRACAAAEQYFAYRRGESIPWTIPRER